MDTLLQLIHGLSVAVAPHNLLFALIGVLLAPRWAYCRASARRSPWRSFCP